MRLSSLLFSIPFVVAFTAGAIGCGSDPAETSGGNACIDYTKFAGMAPVVTFKTDVLPILRNSCALSNSCHGAQGGPAKQPYLGLPGMGAITQGDIDAIFTANVNVESVGAPGMMIIKSGDAANSFLVHKIDNTLSCPEVTCDGAACGGLMPFGSATVMDEAKRDTIRRWIIQGAKND